MRRKMMTQRVTDSSQSQLGPSLATFHFSPLANDMDNALASCCHCLWTPSMPMQEPLTLAAPQTDAAAYCKHVAMLHKDNDDEKKATRDMPQKVQQNDS